MIKNFTEFVAESLNEKNGDTYSKGCVMAFLDDLEPTMASIQAKIAEDELYEEEGDRTFGLENEPHVTVLYGIHSDEVDEKEVLEMIEKIEWKQPIMINKVGLFENEKYDVLKLNANAEWLKEANAKLCENLPYSNDYPNYNAHVTVAYLKPGKGKELLERLGDIKEKVVPTKMVYSLPNGNKIEIK
jgi:2'-5' RNA ligase